jgi:hypothetical protein
MLYNKNCKSNKFGGIKMKHEDDYITISDFARLAGITPAAIYKRINNNDTSLIERIKVVGSKKYINKNALELFNTTSNKQFNTEVDNRIILIYEENLTTLKTELAVLHQQLENKDKQIDGYIMQISELNKHLENQTLSVRESLFITAGGQLTPADTEQQDPEKKGFWVWLKNKLK